MRSPLKAVTGRGFRTPTAVTGRRRLNNEAVRIWVPPEADQLPWIADGQRGFDRAAGKPRVWAFFGAPPGGGLTAVLCSGPTAENRVLSLDTLCAELSPAFGRVAPHPCLRDAVQGGGQAFPDLGRWRT